MFIGSDFLTDLQGVIVAGLPLQGLAYLYELKFFNLFSFIAHGNFEIVLHQNMCLN